MSGKVVTYVEPDAIIRKVQGHLVRGALHPYLYFIRTGVLDGVVEGLLGDAVDGLFRFQRGLRLLVECGFDLDTMPGPECCGLFFERGHEPFGLRDSGRSSKISALTSAKPASARERT